MGIHIRHVRHGRTRIWTWGHGHMLAARLTVGHGAIPPCACTSKYKSKAVQPTFGCSIRLQHQLRANRQDDAHPTMAMRAAFSRVLASEPLRAPPLSGVPSRLELGPTTASQSAACRTRRVLWSWAAPLAKSRPPTSAAGPVPVPVGQTVESRGLCGRRGGRWPLPEPLAHATPPRRGPRQRRRRAQQRRTHRGRCGASWPRLALDGAGPRRRSYSHCPTPER